MQSGKNNERIGEVSGFFKKIFLEKTNINPSSLFTNNQNSSNESKNATFNFSGSDFRGVNNKENTRSNVEQDDVATNQEQESDSFSTVVYASMSHDPVMESISRSIDKNRSYAKIRSENQNIEEESSLEDCDYVSQYPGGAMRIPRKADINYTEVVTTGRRFVTSKMNNPIYNSSFTFS